MVEAFRFMRTWYGREKDPDTTRTVAIWLTPTFAWILIRRSTGGAAFNSRRALARLGLPLQDLEIEHEDRIHHWDLELGDDRGQQQTANLCVAEGLPQRST